MIIVMPEALTKYQGSLYSSSVTIGDWEAFVTRDLEKKVLPFFSQHLKH
jgi:hypothetical protein